MLHITASWLKANRSLRYSYSRKTVKGGATIVEDLTTCAVSLTTETVVRNRVNISCYGEMHSLDFCLFFYVTQNRVPILT